MAHRFPLYATLGFFLSAPALAQTAPGLRLPEAWHALDCVVPTSPHPVQEVQPDGTAVELRFRGTGLNAWYEDADGYPVVRGTDGWFVYARLDAERALAPTAHAVGTARPGQAGIPRHVTPVASPRTAPLQPGQKVVQPHPGGGAAFAGGTGTVKNLVVLMRFSDHGPGGQDRTLPSSADVDKIMNAPGGDPVLAPTGSVNDHYQEMSYGQFAIDSFVADWVTVPESEVYYANGNSGLTSQTWELITDALDLVDASVDFADFDEDGDGVVDAITFLHSGYGAEWGGTDQYDRFYTDRMWSHKWSIPTWTSAEGISVSAYHISPGLWATSGSDPGRIGVVSHETGHFFGLPDLYDTDGSSNGNGNWCLMAAGSWGFDGSQRNPSHMQAWAKSKLGWLEPQLILPGSHSAPQVEDSATVYKIDNGYHPDEYLLIENREPTGFDAVIPQGGLAIWHVDETKGSLWFNNPNTDEGYPGQPGWPGNGSHFRSALLQPDDDWDLELDENRGDSGDVYHAGGVSLVDSVTSPGTGAYQSGTLFSSGNRISAIGAAGANVSFTYQNNLLPTITSGAPPAGSAGRPYSFNLAAAGGVGMKTWSEFLPDPDYIQTDLGSSLFSATGVAQGWNADDDIWNLALPFPFPYYETAYDEVWVSSNGFIAFGPIGAEAGNAAQYLRAHLRIAPLWDDLVTDQAGGDIFVDTSVAGEVKIHWNAETWGSGDACLFAVVLFDDGRIRFDYGDGNFGLSPTIGISRGEGAVMMLPSGYDGASSLDEANSIQFELTGSQIPPGMSLSAAGVLSGTPATTGTWTPAIRVRDTQYHYDQDQLTLAVIVDCNGNGVDDALDISGGTSDDCDGNDVPDECQPDCDGDSLPDACEVDCNGNGTPDECESFDDCNSNGIPDDCDPDCDEDGVPNDCEPDCDGDGTSDNCEILGGASDLDEDGVPDECQIETFCTAKRNSDGCRPVIDFTGLPTVSGADDFFVTVSDVVARTNGVLYLSGLMNGAGGQMSGSPLGAGLCVLQPVVVEGQGSGGAGSCGGSFSFHVPQSLIAASGLVGSKLYVQCLYRDPAHPDGTGTGQSAALRFPILP